MTTTEKLKTFAEDAVHFTVGLGVYAAQQLQGVVEPQVRALDDRVKALGERCGAALDDVQGRLPEPADEWFGKARQAADAARTQVRERVLRDAA
ncbi:MAG TPA: hypothetical protein VG478_13750 [Acidimicrobiales bacterium]|jgi:hypothetical protein|nr:hypothetical protein [Acidimicrobiales bacterium]